MSLYVTCLFALLTSPENRLQYTAPQRIESWHRECLETVDKAPKMFCPDSLRPPLPSELSAAIMQKLMSCDMC